MKRAMVLLLVANCATIWGQKTRFGQAAQSAKASPAYDIAVHVSQSRLVNVCNTDMKGSSCGFEQELTVTIDGRKLTLSEQGNDWRLLRTGDYRARIAKDDTSRPYEYWRVYEFQFPNGKTGRYFVIGETE